MSVSGKCGHISRHWGLITGPSAPGALQLWPAVGSSGVTPPKIRRQGIFNAHVSDLTRPPNSYLRLLCGSGDGVIYLLKQTPYKYGKLNITWFNMLQNKTQCHPEQYENYFQI